MRKRILVAVGGLAAVGVVVGVAVALWLVTAEIQTRVGIGSKPALLVATATTDDDGAVQNPLIDGSDTGADPSGPGPNSTRYTVNIGTCTASKNSPANNQGTLTLASSFGGYWCTARFELQNLTRITTLTRVTWGATALTECPSMTSIDTDTSGEPDIEVCFQGVTEAGATVPLLGVTLEPSEVVNSLLKLHILDGATPVQEINAVVTYEGALQ